MNILRMLAATDHASEGVSCAVRVRSVCGLAKWNSMRWFQYRSFELHLWTSPSMGSKHLMWAKHQPRSVCATHLFGTLNTPMCDWHVGYSRSAWPNGWRD